MATALQTVAMFSNVLQYKPTFAESLQIHSAAAFRQNQLLMQQEQVKAKKAVKLKDELENVQDNIRGLEYDIQEREAQKRVFAAQRDTAIEEEKAKRDNYKRQSKEDREEALADAKDDIKRDQDKVSVRRTSLESGKFYRGIAVQLMPDSEEAKAVDGINDLRNVVTGTNAITLETGIIEALKDQNQLRTEEDQLFIRDTDIPVRQFTHTLIKTYDLGSNKNRGGLDQSFKSDTYSGIYEQENKRIERKHRVPIDKDGKFRSDEDIEADEKEVYDAKVAKYEIGTDEKRELLEQAQEDEKAIVEMMVEGRARDPLDMLREEYGVTDPFTQSPVLRERKIRIEGETPIDREIQRLADAKIPIYKEPEGPPTPPVVQTMVEPVRKVTEVAETVPVIGRELRRFSRPNILVPEDQPSRDIVDEQIRQKKATDLQNLYRKRAERTRKQQERREQAASILETGKEKVQGLFRRDETVTPSPEEAEGTETTPVETDETDQTETQQADIKSAVVFTDTDDLRRPEVIKLLQEQGVSDEDIEGKTVEELEEMLADFKVEVTDEEKIQEGAKEIQRQEVPKDKRKLGAKLLGLIPERLRILRPEVSDEETPEEKEAADNNFREKSKNEIDELQSNLDSITGAEADIQRSSIQQELDDADTPEKLEAVKIRIAQFQQPKADPEAVQEIKDAMKTDTPDEKPKKPYIVKKDDTFGEIAQQHGMTTAELQKLNPQIKNIAQIDVGDKINVQ